jgi:ABC-2 type transport system permease protein
MRNIAAIARRELAAYFNSPIAYVVAIFFLVVTACWFFFVQQFFAQDAATLRGYFSVWPFLFIVLLPAITMRSWAEERRQGTAEILLTLPFREGELVAGKFAAAFTLLCIVVALTVPVPLSVLPLGSFEPGQITTQYIGAVLLGGAGLAAGLFLSALSANQVTAFLFGALFLLFITMIGQVPAVVVLPGWLSGILSWLSLDYHFDSFRKGVFDTRDALYLMVLAGGFLTFNAKVLLLRRFR